LLALDVPSLKLMNTGETLSPTDPVSTVESWYTSEFLSVSANDTEPRDPHFSSDGTKLYVLGNSGNNILQYTLSTPWDIKTAGAAVESPDVTAQDASPYGFFFSYDGTNLYILGGSSTTIYQYTLSIAWDISTISYASKSFAVTSYDSSSHAIFFDSTGTRLFLIGYANDAIHKFTLTTAWDIGGTVTWNQTSASVATYEGNAQGLYLSSDGTKLWIVGSSYNTPIQYDLGTAWDLSTMTYNSKVNLFFSDVAGTSYVITGSSGIFVNETQGKAWISDYSNDGIFELTINKPITKISGNKLLLSTPIVNIDGTLNLNKYLRVNLDIRCGASVYSSSNYSSNYYTASSTTSPSIVTNVTTGNVSFATGQTTGNLTIGGTTQTGYITLGQSTGAQTLNIGDGATTASTTKTINIGGSGVSTSITNINLGSSVSGATGTTTVNSTLKCSTTASVGAATPATSGAGITFPATQSASTDANTLDDYREYTAASTACTGAITTACVWKATRVGNIVTVTLPSVTGAGVATSSFVFGVALPSAYRPSADFASLTAPLTDNGAKVTAPGLIKVVASTGVMSVFLNGLETTNFTATATAGLTYSTSISWTV
jgi:hypothetical protein